MIDLLDVVVWLDAPESVLLRRIGGRTKEIIRGGGTEAELKQLLKAYRVAYREVIEAIRATGRTTIIEVDTATTSPGQTAATILAALAPPSSPSRSSSARC
jgi:shikimate kinase